MEGKCKLGKQNEELQSQLSEAIAQRSTILEALNSTSPSEKYTDLTNLRQELMATSCLIPL